MATELKRATTTLDRIEELLGENARTLLDHKSEAIAKEQLNLPVRISLIASGLLQIVRRRCCVPCKRFSTTAGSRAAAIFRSCPSIRASNISAGASFAPNPQYFDPANIVKLAIEGGCNAVASTFGVLGVVARKYAHKIPFIVKINHNELLTLPNKFDQVLFGTVKEAHNLGAVAVGAYIYFGSDESTRQITEIANAFAQAHELLAWAPFSGATFAIRDSKRRKETCTPPRTSPDRRTISASRSRPTSSSKNFRKETVATRRWKNNWASPTAKPASWFTKNSRPTIQSIWFVIRWPTVTWAAVG